MPVSIEEEALQLIHVGGLRLITRTASPERRTANSEYFLVGTSAVTGSVASASFYDEGVA